MNYDELKQHLESFAALAISLHYINDIAKNDAGDGEAANCHNMLKCQLQNHYDTIRDSLNCM